MIPPGNESANEDPRLLLALGIRDLFNARRRQCLSTGFALKWPA